MKLSNIFKGNVLVITQSPHGDLQNKKSIDCVGANGDLTIYAPADGVITAKYGSGTQSGFHLVADNWDILFHHCATDIRANTNVKRGQIIGKSSWYHVHTAIRVDGVWNEILDYMDRNIKLDLASGFNSQHWKNWSTWGDLQLSPVVPEKNKESYELLKGQRPDVIKVYPLEKIHYWFRDHGLVEYPRLVRDLSADIVNKEADLKIKAGVITELNERENGYKDHIDSLKSQIKAIEEEKLSVRKENLVLEARIGVLEGKLQKFQEKTIEDTNNLFIKLIKWLTRSK